MRLFIAINFNNEMKSALIEAQNQLYDAGVRGNYSSEENLHLTLAFIGEFPDPDQVLDIMESAQFTPFELTLDGLGCFGDNWWAGLAGSVPLQAVARRLRRALADNGIPYDRKPFRPHITLLRKARAEHGMPPVEIPAASMQIKTISLMRSDRGRSGMIYTELGTIEAQECGR